MSLMRSRAAQLAGVVGLVMILFFAFGLPDPDQTREWSSQISSKWVRTKPEHVEGLPNRINDVFNQTLGVRIDKKHSSEGQN